MRPDTIIIDDYMPSFSLEEKVKREIYIKDLRQSHVYKAIENQFEIYLSEYKNCQYWARS